jgi:AAA15 family ATPase/GTPase
MIITEKITAFYGQNGSGKTSILKKVSTDEDMFYSTADQDWFHGIYNKYNLIIESYSIENIADKLNTFLPFLDSEIVYVDYVDNQLLFTHTGGIENTDGWRIVHTLTYREESDGIKKLVYLLPMIINAIQEDKLLFIDDIETFLNPNIVKFIIELFKKSKTGKLIFSSNDTNTMLQLKHKNIKLVKRVFGETIIQDIPTDCTVKKFKKDFDNGEYGRQPIIQDEAFFYSIFDK